MPHKDPARHREYNRNYYRFGASLGKSVELENAELFLNSKTRCIAFYRIYEEKPPHPDYERDAQRQTVERLVARAGAKLIGAYVQPEKCGPGLNKRPQLGAALATCEVQGAMLIIAKLGHLASSGRILSQLATSGVDFVACDKPHVNHRTIAAVALAVRRMEKTRNENIRAVRVASKAKGIPWDNTTAEGKERARQTKHM